MLCTRSGRGCSMAQERAMERLRPCVVSPQQAMEQPRPERVQAWGKFMLCCSSVLLVGLITPALTRDTRSDSTWWEFSMENQWLVAILHGAVGFSLVLVLCPETVAQLLLHDSFMRASHFLYVVFVVSLFMVCGPALILLNKHVMQGLAFNYPLTLGGIGVVASAIVSHIAIFFGFARISEKSADATRGLKWFKVALPIGFLKALTLGTGNAVYMYLGVGFIQMLKAFTPTIVISVTRLLHATSLPPLPVICCAGVIVLGTLLEVKGEMAFSVTGVIIMLISETSDTVSSVLGEVLLQEQKFTVMETMYFVAPPTALCIACVAAVVEWPRLVPQGGLTIVAQHPEHFVLCSVLGVFVNFLGWMLIQATSTLTLKILNAARCVALVIIGVLFYNETVSQLGGIGYTITMIGFAGYNYLQMNRDLAQSWERSIHELVRRPAAPSKEIYSS